MGMYHSTSGKMGEEYYDVPGAHKFPRKELIKVLKAEDKLRRSKKTQERYSEQMRNGDNYLRHISKISQALQEQALRSCGYHQPEDLDSFRSHRSHYAGDKEIASLSMYGKYDKSKAMGELPNKPAGEVEVVDLNGNTKFLSDYVDAARVTFIIASNFEGEVDFLMVYVKEAHAQDEWPLGNIVCIDQHRSIEERITAAKEMKEEYDFPITTVVDTIDNQFNELFCAWPERYYLFKGEDIAFHSSPNNEFGVNRLALRSVIADAVDKKLDELPIDKYPVLSNRSFR